MISFIMASIKIFSPPERETEREEREEKEERDLVENNLEEKKQGPVVSFINRKDSKKLQYLLTYLLRILLKKVG